MKLASFTINNLSLIDIIKMTNEIIYFKLLNHEIRFIEFGQGRRLIGVINNAKDYILSNNIMKLDVHDKKRTVAIEGKTLWLFVGRLNEQNIRVEIFNDKIVLYDSDNEIRKSELPLKDTNTTFKDEEFVKIYNRTTEASNIDGILYSKMMTDHGNFFILQHINNKYHDNDIPCDEIQWKFIIHKDKVELIEQRISENGETHQDVWIYGILNEHINEDFDRPTELITQYNPEVLSRYANISGTEYISLVFVKNKANVISVGVFLITNNGFLSTLSALRPKMSELSK